MGVIFELDEYVVLKDFGYNTAIHPNRNPSQVLINFKKGQRIGGTPARQRDGMTLVIDVDGRKVYLPIKYANTLLKQTGRKVPPQKQLSFNVAGNQSAKKKYCFNYSVEGILNITGVYQCVCASNSKEAYRIAKDRVTADNYPRRVEVYKTPYSPKHANPMGYDYVEKLQTYHASCMEVPKSLNKRVPNTHGTSIGNWFNG